MNLLSEAMAVYPYWALPIAFVWVELGVYFRRRNRPIQYFFWVGAIVLCVGFLAWMGLNHFKF